MLDVYKDKIAERVTKLPVGTEFELKDLLSEEWPEVPAPTSMGKHFKAAVIDGEFPLVEPLGDGTDNHQKYRRRSE